jgi:XTP/dITP diphosphohydrolase
MRRTLYIATTNAGKLRDLQPATDSHQVSLAALPGISNIPAPIEDAPDFEGNARIKARAYSLRLPGEIVLADDSGLEVDALDGAPGVYSARYAAREGFPNPRGLLQDAWNNACLIQHLAATPAPERTARYRCVLAAARDGVVIATGEGSVEGVILKATRGSGGFGYDPLFLLPELGLTMAEIDAATKISLSHRGRALQALLASLPASS